MHPTVTASVTNVTKTILLLRQHSKLFNEMTAIFQLMFDNKTYLFSHMLTPLLHMQVLSKQNVDDPIQKL